MLDKFLWSKTKADIIKYLFFCREWISIRALENDLPWSFPAIKKQIDSLEKSKVILIDKNWSSWSIKLSPNSKKIISELIFFYLKMDIESLLKKYENFIYRFFYWKLFGNDIENDVDLVIIYADKKDDIKKSIKFDLDKIFSNYFVKVVNITFMYKDEFEHRLRFSDKFVLRLINS